MNLNEQIFDGPTIKLTREQFRRIVKSAEETGLTGPCYVVINSEKVYAPNVESGFLFAYHELNKADESLQIYIVQANGQSLRDFVHYHPYHFYLAIRVPYLNQ